jgi:hypothetical protein
MIGAGSCLTICSKPRLKGSRKPVRVKRPSAKMHTNSPRLSASDACRSDWTIDRIPPVLSMGMTPAHLRMWRRPNFLVQPAKMTKRMTRF